MGAHRVSNILARSVILSLAAFAGCSAIEGQTFPYAIHDLGTFPGASYAYGNALNNTGQVAGGSNIPNTGSDAAFLSRPNGGSPLLNLVDFGGGNSNANAINDSGVVTGYAFTADGNLHAFITAANGASPRDIGTLGGSLCEGDGVNATGQVVGRSFTAGDSFQHAFISDQNGGALRDLGTLGGNVSEAFSVNDEGEVAGTASLAGDTVVHAFLSAPDGGALMDLGTLGGSASNGSGVNNIGQVVGVSNLAGDMTQHGFMTGPGGAGPLVDLGTLGGQRSSAKKINNRGDIIGSSNTATGASHPFLYTTSAGMQDFTTLIDPASGLSVTSTAGINDFGQITGIALNSTNGERAFLANPRYVESFLLGITSVTFAQGTATVAIQGFTGHTYQLQRTSSLNPASWEAVGPPIVPGTDQMLSFVDSDAISSPMFYRVTLMP